MDLTKILSAFVLIVFSFSLGLEAQEKQPLIDLISELETKFDVKFSYSVNDVSNVEVDTLSKTDTLKSVIAKLNATTVLNFKFLTERYITVSIIDKTVSVCGVLISESDKQPLFGASILISHSQRGVITSFEGEFRLSDVPINENIIISFLGFQTQIIKVKELMLLSGSCKTVLMQEKSEELNRVIISKFLTAGLEKRIDGSTVLNTEKFGILPGLTEPDILQSIQTLPGVESVNESIANINVRGGTNDQNLMLWDNIKMYHSGHFFGLISAYNPYLTNKVYVVKNGTSSEFSDGVSSTINMSTKDNLSSTFSGGFGANLIHTDAFLEIPISKKVGLHISGRRSFTDVLNSPTYNNYFERSFQDSELTTNSDNISENNRSSNFFFYDYTAKLLYDFNENHKFRISAIGINNNLDYTETYDNFDNKTESKTSSLKQENIGLGTSWYALWSNRFTTDLNVFYSQYNVDAIDYRIETDQRLTQANEVLETGLKFKTKFKINNVLNFVNGYQFSELGILNETIVSAPSYDKTKKDVLISHAIFSEIEYKQNGTYLRLGIRGNYFQKFNKVLIEPRLSFRQKLIDQFSVKLQGEFKNQSANQKIDFQDDFLGVENRRWILANEQDIPITESKHLSFGFEYNKYNWLIDVEGFYKYVDGITSSNQGFYNNFQYINAVGNYEVKGLEFLINKTTKTYGAWLSYTYSINDYEFESFNPSVFPNNVDIRHSVSVACNYNLLSDLKISIGGIWRSGRPYTKPVEGNETVQSGNTFFVNYDKPNSENLDDFMRLDASLSYNFNITDKVKGVFRAGIMNILDKENNINRYYEVDPNDSESTIQIENTSLGLTPNMSFRAKF